MKKHLLTCLALAVITASLSLLARPVRGISAAKQLPYTDDSAPQNLWVWPTSARSVSDSPDYTPKSVWTPIPYVWYLCASLDGYFFVSPSDRGTWGADWMSSINASGYSVGVFLDLLPGHYVISCEVDLPPQFTLSFYKAVDGGYQWASAISMTAQSTAGVYERVFTVPEEAALTFIRMCSRDAGWSVPSMTVTNIEIYRLD